mmetsp:Transcript_23782/g.74925  ORF Transcript_23782/g.74925 Transcript_23782/m.74925 type:complete len:308 (-) Transcript_23782:53-976(-)
MRQVGIDLLRTGAALLARQVGLVLLEAGSQPLLLRGVVALVHATDPLFERLEVQRVDVPRRQQILDNVELGDKGRQPIVGRRLVRAQDGVEELRVVRAPHLAGREGEVSPSVVALVAVVHVQRQQQPQRGWEGRVRDEAQRHLLHVGGGGVPHQHRVAQLAKHLVQPRARLEAPLQGERHRTRRGAAQLALALPAHALVTEPQQPVQRARGVAEAVHEAARRPLVVVRVREGARKVEVLDVDGLIRLCERGVLAAEQAEITVECRLDGVFEEAVLEDPAEAADHAIVSLAVRRVPSRGSDGGDSSHS